MRVCIPHYYAFYAYTASAEFKRRIVMISAEFGGKQSHGIGPLDLLVRNTRAQFHSAAKRQAHFCAFTVAEKFAAVLVCFTGKQK